MKYERTQTPKRTQALFLALNWYLTDQIDLEDIDELVAKADEAPSYSEEELQASLAMRYAGRFSTSRLRKKRADDLSWLKRSKEMDWSRFKS